MNKRSAWADSRVAPKSRLRVVAAVLLWMALAAGIFMDLMALALGAMEPSGMCLIAALGCGMVALAALSERPVM